MPFCHMALTLRGGGRRYCDLNLKLKCFLKQFHLNDLSQNYIYIYKKPTIDNKIVILIIILQDELVICTNLFDTPQRKKVNGTEIKSNFKNIVVKFQE